MGVRRDGRETAVQFLFSNDITKESNLEDLDNFFLLSTARSGAKKFAKELLQGILDQKENIDQIIKANVDNFEINRLSAVDRNV